MHGKSLKLQKFFLGSQERERHLEEQKRAKIIKIKEINKNYARIFVPPPKITAKSYIVCEALPEGMKVVVSYNSKNAQ
jgi:hypothetical protein